jgi:hypothetical protein
MGYPDRPALYARAREQTIFNGDAAIVATLQQASDGFEHGYLDLGAVREMLKPILLEVAQRVRHALIKVLALDSDHEKALVASEFDEPRPLLPQMRIIRGQIRVTDRELAPAAIGDPVEVDWQLGEQAVTRNAEGKLTTTRQTTATLVHVPPGICLDVTSSGVRGIGISKYEVSDVVVKRAAKPEDVRE